MCLAIRPWNVLRVVGRVAEQYGKQVVGCIRGSANEPDEGINLFLRLQGIIDVGDCFDS
jgi:hypothetical protein